MKGNFQGSLQIDYIDGKSWSKRGEMKYISSRGIVYSLPDGYKTDGASSRLLGGHFNFLPTEIQNSPPAWLHDLHYATGHAYRYGRPDFNISRREADRIFLEGLRAQTVGTIVTYSPLKCKWKFSCLLHCFLIWLHFFRWHHACFIAWLGVRIGGFYVWNKYRRHEKQNSLRL